MFTEAPGWQAFYHMKLSAFLLIQFCTQKMFRQLSFFITCVSLRVYTCNVTIIVTSICVDKLFIFFVVLVIALAESTTKAERILCVTQSWRQVSFRGPSFGCLPKHVKSSMSKRTPTWWLICGRPSQSISYVSMKCLSKFRKHQFCIMYFYIVI